ncbi:hypothetical protein CROQUDRAFT_100769 [Cronartium quercuum f. sp. fusiforme G11]|uniref:DDE Tnp4 domain-containing protein n=1 Tax=Cronartium quercuum f. sp. fusiforme G11 TaxID=708437 RepID=A0A9P6N9W1_9BASI|nr:hypothetical protein CROQUDRAFT_100769 [Cronartium quercuum f. sp. fusiforme G11]
MLWDEAQSTGLAIPPGQYLLGNAGFALNEHPVNKEELFNLRHAGAHNVIERIFGFDKKKFNPFLNGCEYSVPMQSQIILLMCFIHNFLQREDPDETTWEFKNLNDEDWPLELEEQSQPILHNMGTNDQELEAATNM